MKKAIALLAVMFILLPAMAGCAAEAPAADLDDPRTDTVPARGDDSDEFLRLAVFPTGTYNESYFFVLTNGGALKGSMGTRSGDVITQGDFLDNADASAEKQLSGNELQTLRDMAYALEKSGFDTGKQYGPDDWMDSWYAALLFNGKVYEADYWHNEGAEALMALIDRIIDLSSLEVDIHGWS